MVDLESKSLSLDLVRRIDLFRDRCRKQAATEIKRERQGYYLFGATDDSPNDWPTEDVGDGICDNYCHPCALKALRIARKKGVVVKGYDGEEYEGPFADHSGEGESSRNCYFCGRPLPWALLEYGIESECEHYASQFFRDRAVKEGISPNDWYWLWRVLDECAGCEKYMVEHGPSLLPLWAWLQGNGFFDAKPGKAMRERMSLEECQRLLL